MKKLSSIIFSICLSSIALADVVQFRKHVYDSLDQLTQAGIAKFDDSLKRLRMAEDMASKRPSRVLIREATKGLVDLSHGRVLTTEDQEPLNVVIEKLKKSLQYERIQFSRFSEDELNIVENFVLYSLFAERAPLVKVEYRGIARDLAISLMITYFMEPRAAKYDPDMKILLPSETTTVPDDHTITPDPIGPPDTPDIAPESNAKVVFILPEEKLEIPSANGSMDEVNKRLGSLLPKDLPVRLKTRVYDGATFVHLEIWSIEAVQVVEKSLRDILVMGSGNFYLWHGANFLELMQTRLAGMYVGGVGRFQTGIDLASKFLGNIESKIRDSLMSSKWIGATEDTVKQMLQKETASTISHMTANLERRLAQLKAAGRAERFLELEKAKTAQWIENANKKLADSLARIDKSVAALDKSSSYAKASESVKSAMRLEAAENAAKRSIWKLDNWLKAVVIGVSVYYVVEGAIQWTRAETKSEADKIAQKYGVKAADNLLYAIPSVNTFAFAWNMTVAGLSLGGDKLFDYDFPDLSTERGLNFLVDKGSEIGYTLGGTTRFAFVRDNLVVEQGLLPMYRNEVGYWSGVELKKLEIALNEAKGDADSTRKVAAMKTFGEEVRALGLKNLVVLYSLKNEKVSEREYLSYIKELEQKWTSPKSGYTSYLRMIAAL